MPERLRRGALTGPLRALRDAALPAAEAALTKNVLRVERSAKRRVREGGQHKAHTKTTAVPGGGPAVISGDLARSITHAPIERLGMTLRTRVGPSSVPHRAYPRKDGSPGRSRGTTSGVIGEALETGAHGARFPFLGPAVRDNYGSIMGAADAYRDELLREFFARGGGR